MLFYFIDHTLYISFSSAGIYNITLDTRMMRMASW